MPPEDARAIGQGAQVGGGGRPRQRVRRVASRRARRGPLARPAPGLRGGGQSLAGSRSDSPAPVRRCCRAPGRSPFWMRWLERLDPKKRRAPTGILYTNGRGPGRAVLFLPRSHARGLPAAASHAPRPRPGAGRRAAGGPSAAPAGGEPARRARTAGRTRCAARDPAHRATRGAGSRRCQFRERAGSRSGRGCARRCRAGGVLRGCRNRGGSAWRSGAFRTGARGASAVSRGAESAARGVVRAARDLLGARGAGRRTRAAGASATSRSSGNAACRRRGRATGADGARCARGVAGSGHAGKGFASGACAPRPARVESASLRASRAVIACYNSP